MLVVYTDRILNRLAQLVTEIQRACDIDLDYHDRIREFKRFCDETPAISHLLNQLPDVPYDFTSDWREIPNQWRGGKESYGIRWSAIYQMAEGGPAKVVEAWLQLNTTSEHDGLRKITDLFVVPIYHFLSDQLQSSSAMSYVLLRYKRWAEWFGSAHLRETYEASDSDGESTLDENLRRFLFESGIDYPFSQPASPRGKVDVIAGLESDDPLILEIKIWDSKKGYKENRVRDGLRQAMDYSAKFGKDKGYIVVFNLDQEPLSFTSQTNKGEWPPRIEYGGRTYFFIEVQIAEKLKPISQQNKGKPVRVNEIDLAGLLDNILSA